MSYVAIATDSFDEVTGFYGELLGFPVVEQWDRANGRGRRFDLGGGLRLEVLDNSRERERLALFPPGQRVHIVIEVEDAESARAQLPLTAPPVQGTSWGAKLFTLQDPDGVSVTYLQWTEQSA